MPNFQSWSVALRQAIPDIQPPFCSLALNCKLDVEDEGELTITEMESMADSTGEDGFDNRVKVEVIILCLVAILGIG